MSQLTHSVFDPTHDRILLMAGTRVVAFIYPQYRGQYRYLETLSDNEPF